MTLHRFTFNPFATNMYVVASEGEAVIIDAASSRAAEHAQVVRLVEREGYAVRHLLLTHAHIDHVFGCAALAEAFGLEWHLHPHDAIVLQHAEAQAQYFGVPFDAPPPLDTQLLHAGDSFAFGACQWQVHHVPGHSPGSVAFYDATHGVVFAGDVLFHGSIGRTDLPLGDLPTLQRSLHETMLGFPDTTRVLSGHGPETTIGHERATNPFLT